MSVAAVRTIIDLPTIALGLQKAEEGGLQLCVTFAQGHVLFLEEVGDLCPIHGQLILGCHDLLRCTRLLLVHL
jgi:hypothetical protein